MTFLLLGLFLGTVIGALVAWLWGRSHSSVTKERLDTAIRDLQNAVGVREENEKLKIQIAEMKKEREADTDKLQWQEKAQEKLREAFQALASQILQSNADEFLKRTRDQLSGLLTEVRGDWNNQKTQMQQLVQPLEITLQKMDGHIRELEQKREGAYKGLDEQLRQLYQSHQQMRTATIKLEQALKSPTVRGAWGQIQLRRVVEMAGMQEHVTFDEQAAGDEGRPDMIVYLPNQAILAMDAKAPMQAYLEAMETSDGEIAKAKLMAHAKAVKDRVIKLSQKKYWEQFEHSPEFVIMFLPNDNCLSVAFEYDGGLLEFAYDQRVLLTTPITLLALLKAVVYGWQQQQIAENAQQIASQGKELYDRLLTFVEHLKRTGTELDSAVKAYNEAMGSLERRLFPAARKFKELGAFTAEVPDLPTIERQTQVPITQ